jgi:hypothetical protein
MITLNARHESQGSSPPALAPGKMNRKPMICYPDVFW